MYSVVLLEDDEWILKGIQASFNWEKYRFEVVKAFLDPNDLIEYLNDHEVDVVFTDLKMPHMTGIELISKIKFDLGKDTILFVIISAYYDYSYMREAINLGVTDYCRKPINRNETDAILEKLSLKLKKPDEITKEELLYNPDFQNMIEYINKNYSQKLRLKELAKMFYFNHNYLCLLFNKNLGITFSEYVLKIRMEKAKELFDTKPFSITQISYMVGFNDYSYFHKVFTGYYGVTPAIYKKNVVEKLKGED